MAIDAENCNIANIQMVSMNGSGDDICVIMPHNVMSKEQALVHAAWIVALADGVDGEFETILARVRAT